MTALRGITMVYTEGVPSPPVSVTAPDHFAWLGTGYLLGLPVPIWLMAIVFLLAWYCSTTHSPGPVYALGGNESATRLSGINVDRVRARGLRSVRHAVGTGGLHVVTSPYPPPSRLPAWVTSWMPSPPWCWGTSLMGARAASWGP